MAPVVNLHVTLLDKSQGTAVAGSASLDTCVWKLGEQVGMLNITTSPASNFGYIFRSAAGVWKSNQHPKLTLADAGVKNTGDMVQFMGDFEPFTPAPVVPGAVVELQMMLIGKGKTSNVTGKATLDKCVWELGYEVGLQRASDLRLQPRPRACRVKEPRRKCRGRLKKFPPGRFNSTRPWSTSM